MQQPTTVNLGSATYQTLNGKTVYYQMDGYMSIVTEKKNGVKSYSDFVSKKADVAWTLDRSRELLDRLHVGGTLRHFWTPNGRKSGNGKESLWVPVEESGYLPLHWINAGQKKHTYFCINPAAVSITDADRQKSYLVGKSDEYIQSYTRGKNNQINAVNCVFADFDGKDFAEPTTDMVEAKYSILRESPEHATARDKTVWNMSIKAAKEDVFAGDMNRYNQMAFEYIRNLPIQPSAWWFSGGGFQGVWLLDETISISDVETLNYAKSLQRRWTQFVGGDPAAKDLARILRLPGSWNIKKIYPEPQLVRYVDFNLNLTYSANQIIDLFPVIEETNNKPVEKRKKTTVTPPAYIKIDNGDDIDLDCDNLSAYAIRIMAEYNATRTIKDELLRFGYTNGSNGRLCRPGRDSDSVAIFPNNRSWHHSSSDVLYTDDSNRPRSPFDVVVAYQFGGDYEDAALEIGRELGILTHGDMEDFLKRHRALVLNADWSKIVPVDRQSKRGYRTGNTDRMLYDNGLDYAKKAGRIKGLKLSLRTITECTNTEGVKVAVASHVTARNFIDRVNGVLLNCDLPVPDKDKDGDFAVSTLNTIIDHSEKDHGVQSNDDKSDDKSSDHKSGLVVDLVDFAVSTLNTIIDHSEKDHGVQSNDDKSDDKTGEITFSLGGMKADDSFARGTSRFQKKQAKIATIGDDDRKITDSLDEMLPGLGFFGLITVVDLLENPGTTKTEIAQRRGMKPSAVGVALRKLEDWNVVEYEQDCPRKPKLYTIADDALIQFSERIANTRTYKIGVQRLERRLEQMQTQAEMDAYAAAEKQNEQALNVAEKRVNRAVERRTVALAAIYPGWTLEEIEKYIFSPKLTLKPWLDRIDQSKDADIRVAEKEEFRKQMTQTIIDFKRQGIKGREAYRMAEQAGYTSLEAARIAKEVKYHVAMH
jgi:DNA-binding transcriptional regulator GbsR (MarR family)